MENSGTDFSKFHGNFTGLFQTFFQCNVIKYLHVMFLVFMASSSDIAYN